MRYQTFKVLTASDEVTILKDIADKVTFYIGENVIVEYDGNKYMSEVTTIGDNFIEITECNRDKEYYCWYTEA
jgi:hypothetical protein